MDGESGNVELLLRAVVTLLADQRERDLGRAESERKIELLLFDAGLDAKQIAMILNKNYDAVRKAIARAKGTS